MRKLLLGGERICQWFRGRTAWALCCVAIRSQVALQRSYGCMLMLVHGSKPIQNLLQNPQEGKSLHVCTAQLHRCFKQMYGFAPPTSSTCSGVAFANEFASSSASAAATAACSRKPSTALENSIAAWKKPAGWHGSLDGIISMHVKATLHLNGISALKHTSNVRGRGTYACKLLNLRWQRLQLSNVGRECADSLLQLLHGSAVSAFDRLEAALTLARNQESATPRPI